MKQQTETFFNTDTRPLSNPCSVCGEQESTIVFELRQTFESTTYQLKHHVLEDDTWEEIGNGWCSGDKEFTYFCQECYNKRQSGE